MKCRKTKKEIWKKFNKMEFRGVNDFIGPFFSKYCFNYYYLMVLFMAHSQVFLIHFF